MARPVSTILKSLIGKLATGFALGRRDGVLDAHLQGVATALADAEAGAEALMTETDPRSADKLLADFERCLGPDPCGRDRAALTVEQRRKLAHQRWTARGGQSIPFFISIARALGVEITIDEFWPSRAGGLRAGQRLRPEGCQFVWRVNIPGLVTVINFRAGISRAGQRLGSFELSSIECELRRLKPAHTHIVFSYGEA
ncbi:Uncharacterized protein YmfQ in lambdoid prophage, DUF2313 family [Rhizobium sp. RU35A]|uniref:YmfQ family protein n=1 Tax=Rhizobium sp. RU35A TaxID=1907414 RepID=UPI000953A28A|nr:putative phage tail protein [Rhizobium sp. RU35A]SIQ23681.1 Uncharacterized protein YmfQ in lambdoid prophage, DUF2313 family [Rhizobium sp. RU35A]